MYEILLAIYRNITLLARVEVALVYGLKVRVGCQDRLCVNSDADETVA